MAVKDVFKISFKTFFNPSGWLGYREVKDYTRTIAEPIKELMTVPTPQRQENFENAVARFNLSEEELQKIAENYKFFTIIFLFFAVVSFLASLYFLFGMRSFLEFLLGIAVTSLFSAQAFRYDFWRFQIKHRKLGCTFAEWKRGKPFDREDASS